MSIAHEVADRRVTIGGVVAALLVLVIGSSVWDLPLVDILTVGAVQRTLRAATPIALAAIGGLYAEKSGVFNIGLEGFMIFGAFIAAAAAWIVSGGGTVTQAHLWVGVVTATLACALLTVVFAVLTVRFEANQIVAGLAVWFIALGFAPFSSIVLWDGVSSPSLPNIATLTVPGLSSLPVVGPILFDISPLVVLTVIVTAVAWVGLYRTRYGYWVQAAGENPEALDTAGVNVNRVRFAAVILSGALAGLAGATLSVGFAGGFTGSGVTMVDGRGWIAITAYLFANYNPIGAFAASVLFGGMDALQVQLQTVGISLPSSLTGLFPYVAVLVVLVLVGRTRMPAAAGEPYDTED
ncbi:ABC transporter permease [Haloarcula halophila]|uniref:ABC transporter permease n=1 Tax=Haloarcula TaxID=2237 RepID=UPI0023E398A1|nr:ABC transporter permease [Halomicroarcula sp. DFY41]